MAAIESWVNINKLTEYILSYMLSRSLGKTTTVESAMT